MVSFYMEMFVLDADDPAVTLALFRIRLVMRGVLGEDGYRETALASEEPDEISTDLKRIYFAYGDGDAIYATEIARDGTVMEQLAEGATSRQRFFSSVGELLGETRSLIGDPELN